ncbi:MAG: hypothetical protein DMF44_04440 [Verrucomicrobia bacterium]|nr:MAG: hypothetical protein DMF44_04440 [Verrucomicrobiota bacterium]PYL50525.1 MAG: hypothetical protein DMF32_03965 [Verrucomicrobiota bacterium]
MEAMYPKQRSRGLGSDDLYEIRPRKDRDGFDLISELFRYGPIWYAGPDAVRNAIAYAKYRAHFRSQRAIIRVLDDSGAVVEMHEWSGAFTVTRATASTCSRTS